MYRLYLLHVIIKATMRDVSQSLHCVLLCGRARIIWSWTYPCRDGCGWFLKKIPQPLLILGTFSVAKFLLLALPERLRLLPHFLVHVLFTLMILVLATALEIELVDAPVSKIVAERQHAHLVYQVELAGAIKVEDRAKRLGMSIKKILVVDEGVVVAELSDRLVGVAVP